MPRWLVLLALAATIGAIAITSRKWATPFLGFIKANADIIQTLSSLIQILLWVATAAVAFFAYLAGREPRAALSIPPTPITPMAQSHPSPATTAQDGGVAALQTPTRPASTITATHTPSPTATPSSAAAPCFVAGYEFWSTSWLSGGGVSPPSSRMPDALSCFDIADDGFLAVEPSAGGAFTLHILCGDPRFPCAKSGITRGIYASLEPGQYTFEVVINRLDITKVGTDLSDVDLVLGVGDPLTISGRFIVFRLVNPSGKVHLCALPAYSAQCEPISLAGVDHLAPQTVSFDVAEGLDVSLGGVPVGHTDHLAPGQRYLWIGYTFRAGGVVDAELTFPSSLSRLFINPD